MNATRLRILLFFLGAILVPIGTIAVILFAKGYRPDFEQGQLKPTGLLAATSTPDGAQIFINGKLTSATNTTINLPVGDYTVEIKKIGFQTWRKQLKLQAELVTQTRALLFPTVPSLKAVTSIGASHPIPSSDGTKITFLSKSDLYSLDLSESPLGLLNRDPKFIMTINPTDIAATPSANLALAEERLSLLPETLRQILATAAGELVWSPKENRVLYTATASATIPDKLIPPLPGSNTQTQNRKLESKNTYVYDLEEDKNFQITLPNLQWFPDSAHLVSTSKNKIMILEYDNTNPTVVYAGPMEENFAYPYPSGKQILILTNLTQIPNTSANLYAVSLR